MITASLLYVYSPKTQPHHKGGSWFSSFRIHYWKIFRQLKYPSILKGTNEFKIGSIFFWTPCSFYTYWFRSDLHVLESDFRVFWRDLHVFWRDLPVFRSDLHVFGATYMCLGAIYICLTLTYLCFGVTYMCSIIHLNKQLRC